MLSLLVIFALLITVDKVCADPTDFVNPKYIKQHFQDSSTSSSREKIIRNADLAEKKGPWTIINNNGVAAPGGDKHDYLSWAPYHWPDCNWCTSGHTHLVHSNDGRNETDTEPDNSSTNNADLGPGEDASDPYEEADYISERSSLHYDHLLLASHRSRILRLRKTAPVGEETSSFLPSTPTPNLSSESILDALPVPQAPFITSPSLTTALPTGSLPTPTSHTASNHIAGSSTAPQAAAKTKKPSKNACTPSPTTSMAPSATWTTCPYMVRDGIVNPDVRTLVGAGALNEASDGFFNNVQSYVFTGNSQYLDTAFHLLNTLLFDSETGMNPNMNFGQVVRGPGEQVGTFTGPLDFRGSVKIINGVLLLREIECEQWTSEMDRQFRIWMTQYLDWLQTSPIGKKACSRPNNHGTFCCLSKTALLIALDRIDDAIDTLEKFFSTTFQEQIATSGEQPLEGVRTRPQHYRCFNLEALNALAKIGDYLGKNYWDKQTRYGATIKTAIDFLIKQSRNPGKERAVTPFIAQHVAVATAVWGTCSDYDNFMSTQDYEGQSFWFYDQPSALSFAFGSNDRKRSAVVWRREDDSGVIGFKCPFPQDERVEIDNGIFVTCSDLKHLLESEGLHVE